MPHINPTYVIHVSCCISEFVHNVCSTKFGQFHNELTFIQEKKKLHHKGEHAKPMGILKICLQILSPNDTWQLDISQKLTLINQSIVNPTRLPFLNIVATHLVLVYSPFVHFSKSILDQKRYFDLGCYEWHCWKTFLTKKDVAKMKLAFPLIGIFS
jgi:hypothetical protein